MPQEYVSKASAAEAIGCTRFGLGWLLLCDSLARSFSKDGGDLVETVEWSSVEDYLRWRDSATPRQRRLRSIRNVVSIALHPVGWAVRILGPIISPG